VSSRIFVIFGTRPEAIKLFPLIKELRKRSNDAVRVCVSGQHRNLLDQVLEISRIVPDFDLNIMQQNQSLDELVARMLVGLGEIIKRERPDQIVVQGDTATAMTAALVGYHHKISVSHVEAGLRSGNIYEPWPEEVARRVISIIARNHFAPTQRAVDALIDERIPPERIFLTGNTVVEALLTTVDKIRAEPERVADLARIIEPFGDKRIILVTCHRRESFGEGMHQIAHAIQILADRGDVGIIFPVHPNPNVQRIAKTKLMGNSAIALIEPQDYFHFVHLLSLAYLVLTDSGGVQEEAPSLAKPVLVLRNTTERPEGIDAGTAKLVGTDQNRILANANNLLDDPRAYRAMSKAHNPYGDGLASQRIAKVLLNESI
jgi:UDP-N-acetylglucosamine 2-epimerase (non-hydrolysing)